LSSQLGLWKKKRLLWNSCKKRGEGSEKASSHVKGEVKEVRRQVLSWLC